MGRSRVPCPTDRLTPKNGRLGLADLGEINAEVAFFKAIPHTHQARNPVRKAKPLRGLPQTLPNG